MLATLPAVSWILQNHYSKKENLDFKKNWTCYYTDWIFILINALFLYSIEISETIIVLFIISLSANIYLHKIWGKQNKVEKSHMFWKKTHKLNPAGITHLIFSTIQTTIILSILLFQEISNFIYIQFLLLAIFGLLLLVGSFKIHKKITKMDLSVTIAIFILLIAKTIITIF